MSKLLAVIVGALISHAVFGFSAVAYSESRSQWGVASNSPNPQSATQGAIQDCRSRGGATDCTVIRQYKTTGYGVIYKTCDGHPCNHSIEFGFATPEEARRYTYSICSKRNPRCDLAFEWNDGGAATISAPPPLARDQSQSDNEAATTKSVTNRALGKWPERYLPARKNFISSIKAGEYVLIAFNKSEQNLLIPMLFNGSSIPHSAIDINGKDTFSASGHAERVREEGSGALKISRVSGGRFYIKFERDHGSQCLESETEIETKPWSRKKGFEQIETTYCLKSAPPDWRVHEAEISADSIYPLYYSAEGLPLHENDSRCTSQTNKSIVGAKDIKYCYIVGEFAKVDGVFVPMNLPCENVINCPKPEQMTSSGTGDRISRTRAERALENATIVVTPEGLVQQQVKMGRQMGERR